MANLGIRFEDYDMEEAVGKGAGGTLFRAFRTAENAGRGRRDLIYRAAREVATDVNAVDLVQAQLGRAVGVSHSNLFSSMRSYYATGELILVSDWLPSVTLAALSQRMDTMGRKWPVPAALYLAVELGKALCHLHSRTGPGRAGGLVHGQVNPENVFITYDGQVKILSLGMAAAEGAAAQRRQGHREGLSNFASPEQVAGREIDGRSDLFSLGVLLWGLIAGRPLFAACPREEWIRILNEKTPPPPSQANPAAPVELDNILTKLLDRDRHLRYELGERAAQDMSAVLKFRFPNFGPGDFAAFCLQEAAPFRESYQSYLDQRDASREQTKETILPGTAASAKSTSLITLASPQLSLERPDLAPEPIREIYRPGVQVAEKNRPNARAWLQSALIGCSVLLVVVPLLAPRFLKARKNHAAGPRPEMPKGLIHFMASESDYRLTVNGKTVTVEDNYAIVPANQELAISIKKDGFADIETVTQVMAGEDLDVPVEFNRTTPPATQAHAPAPPASGTDAVQRKPSSAKAME